MAQISVVHYKQEQTQNINILQQNTDNNYAKNNDRKIIVLRKPQIILPQPSNYTKNDILITNPGRKNLKKSHSTDGKTPPQPTAVARRNARERNRVKQVNNGFANLRQHIPSFIAQAYESNTGRNGNKKLSKVETLRMAVEYIRSLEDILAMDGDEAMLNLRKESAAALQNTSNHSSDLSYSVMMSPSEDEDELSTVSTPPPQQYIRINPASNTYEIVSSNMFDNSENLDPMSVHETMLADSGGIDSELEFSQDLSYLQMSNMQANGSLSPEVYSEDSLSPSETKVVVDNQNCFIPVFDAAKLSGNFNVQIKTEKDFPVISLKTEQDIPDCQKQFADVINWWENSSSINLGS